jgi:predicted acylesterase/phospholipase RssA
VIYRHGHLCKVVRSGISIPGLLPPINAEGELLIDGAYLNNMPTDVMREQYGSGEVVAVSISDAVEMAGDVEFGPVVSGWAVARRWLIPWAANVPAPSLGVTVMRAAALSSIHNLGASVRLADLLIVPSVERFGAFEFEAFQQIIDAGYESASRQIDEWQQSRQYPAGGHRPA